jgi:hypothetical protein
MKHILGFAVAALLAQAAGAAPRVISWAGNTPALTQRLGVGEIRLGCSGVPAQCLGSIDQIVKKQRIGHFTLAISPDPDTLADYARQFSEIANRDSRLAGIGIDDFVSVLTRWQKAGIDAGKTATLLRAALDGAKSANGRLQFGITLYADQLGSALLTEPTLPRDLRAAINRVSLYARYRLNGPSYADYLRDARAAFPNAELILGVYPYDRIDYLPCGQKSSTRCSADDELSLFRDTLKVQLSLIAAGQAAGLELYPGTFGTEDTWSGWANPKACAPKRLQQCIALTKSMHDEVLRQLGGS